jgi:hypothetical protein
MATVVISAFNVSNFPEGGGHFWVYTQYALGLQRLGCEVYWLERFDRSGDPNADAARIAIFSERMARFGLAGKLILYSNGERANGASPRAYTGISAPDAEAVFRRADLLLNFHYAIDPDLLSFFRRSALVDIDPGLLQLWMTTGQLAVPPHDVYFSIGETVGTPTALFPDCGVPWNHIRPPVCLEEWPYVYSPHAEAFTTVSKWWGLLWVTDGKDLCYRNDKRASFIKFIQLPRYTPQALELALCLSDKEVDAEDRRFLEGLGWRVRHAYDVAGSPEDYRAYLQQSRGEFGCAKPSYVNFQTAWVSDRTPCYLASGKPVVVQDTGPSSYLPNGEGMFRFSTIEEAAAAFEVINSNYQRHCRAAREIAEAHFDSKRILEGILNRALRHRVQQVEQMGVGVTGQE